MSQTPARPAASPAYLIRKYHPADRDIVRRLCCETGFLGQPIDPVFEDRELFADFLTTYCTLDREPESAFIIEIGGAPKGYLLGCRRPLRNQLHNFLANIRQFFALVARYPGYSAASRRFVHWIFMNAWREVPASPRRTPHFHINLLPEARSVQGTAELIDSFCAYLRAQGETKVFGQMVTRENRRGEKMFKRYGFKVLNRAEITKYRRLHPEPVYLCTVIKDLEENVSIYGKKSVCE